MTDRAIKLCRYMEPRLRAKGWHVALTGSALYGKFGKDAAKPANDIDLVLYPQHDDAQHDETVPDLMSAIGIKDVEPSGGYDDDDGYGDGASVYEFRLKSGTKVNLFQLDWRL